MREQLTRLWWVGAGSELLVLENRNQKTRCREGFAGMSNRNHRQTANQTAIITDFADWRALWSVVWLWYPESRKVPRRTAADRAKRGKRGRSENSNSN